MSVQFFVFCFLTSSVSIYSCYIPLGRGRQMSDINLKILLFNPLGSEGIQSLQFPGLNLWVPVWLVVDSFCYSTWSTCWPHQSLLYMFLRGITCYWGHNVFFFQHFHSDAVYIHACTVHCYTWSTYSSTLTNKILCENTCLFLFSLLSLAYIYYKLWLHKGTWHQKYQTGKKIQASLVVSARKKGFVINW